MQYSDITHGDSVLSSHHEIVHPATVPVQHDTPGTVPSVPSPSLTAPPASTPPRDLTAQDLSCPSYLPFLSHHAASHFSTSPSADSQIHTLHSASISHQTCDSSSAIPPTSVSIPRDRRDRLLQHISPSQISTSSATTAPFGIGQYTMASTTDATPAIPPTTALPFLPRPRPWIYNLYMDCIGSSTPTGTWGRNRM